MKPPDFIGIGAQRSGTTWLHRALSAHPEVFLPEVKEVHFFDEPPDLSGYEGVGKPGRPFYHDMASRSEWRWYLRQFRPGRRFALRGEITPYYAVLSRERVALVAERLPGAKAVYILRDPVKRAWSGFKLFWTRQSGRRDAPADEGLIRRTMMHPVPLAHGDYRRNVAVWEEAFGRDRVLYLFYDDIVLRPGEVWGSACRFLGVDPGAVDAGRLAERANESPPWPLPEALAAELAAHFAGQVDFIRERFGRVLEF